MGMMVPDGAVDLRLQDTERAILACLLVEPSVVGEIMSRARAEDFIDATYRTIFEACVAVYNSGVIIDPVTVLEKLGLERVVYGEKLMSIMQSEFWPQNWKVYTEILAEQSVLFRMQEIAGELLWARGIEDAQENIEKLNNLLSGKTKAKPVGLVEGFEKFWERHCAGNKVDYLTWGFAQLDKMLFAEAGDLIVLGGLPSSGKTVLAMDFAWHLSHCGKRVGVFSLETGDEKIYDRLYTRQSQVDFSHVKKNELTEDEKQELLKLYPDLSQHVCEVWSVSSPSVQEIRAISLAHHYDIIIIDYIQLMSGTGSTRPEVVTDISISLKSFCRGTKTTVIALSQLTQEKAEKYKTPSIMNFRESKQIGQDADIALFLSLVDPDEKNSDRFLVVDKNKDGPCGAIVLGFDGPRLHFYPRSNRKDEPQKKSRLWHEEKEPMSQQEILETFGVSGGKG